jgi:hypothetical protein
MSREYAERLIDKRYLALGAQASKNSLVLARNQVTRNVDPQWMCL